MRTCYETIQIDLQESLNFFWSHGCGTLTPEYRGSLTMDVPCGFARKSKRRKREEEEEGRKEEKERRKGEREKRKGGKMKLKFIVTAVAYNQNY